MMKYMNVCHIEDSSCEIASLVLLGDGDGDVYIGTYFNRLLQISVDCVGLIDCSFLGWCVKVLLNHHPPEPEW